MAVVEVVVGVVEGEAEVEVAAEVVEVAEVVVVVVATDPTNPNVRGKPRARRQEDGRDKNL